MERGIYSDIFINNHTYPPTHNNVCATPLQSILEPICAVQQIKHAHILLSLYLYIGFLLSILIINTRSYNGALICIYIKIQELLYCRFIISKL
jgi:hypothetical protein